MLPGVSQGSQRGAGYPLKFSGVSWPKFAENFFSLLFKYYTPILAYILEQKNVQEKVFY